MVAVDVSSSSLPPPSVLPLPPVPPLSSPLPSPPLLILIQQKLALSQRVTLLLSENTQLTQLVDDLKTDLHQTSEAKQALEKRSYHPYLIPSFLSFFLSCFLSFFFSSILLEPRTWVDLCMYTLNDLLDVSAESQLVLKAETETLSSDLSKCRIQVCIHHSSFTHPLTHSPTHPLTHSLIQKTTLLEQLSATLREVSILGSEISVVRITTPPPSTIHHPSSIIHHPSSIIHHPSSIIHHPSSIILYIILIMHY